MLKSLLRNGTAGSVLTPRTVPKPVTKSWVRASDLKPGDEIVLADGSTAVVETVTADKELSTVHNFAVDVDHTYFVGETGAWVHNSYRPDPETETGEEETPVITLEGSPSRGGKRPFTAEFDDVYPQAELDAIHPYLEEMQRLYDEANPQPALSMDELLERVRMTDNERAAYEVSAADAAGDPTRYVVYDPRLGIDRRDSLAEALAEIGRENRNEVGLGEWVAEQPVSAIEGAFGYGDDLGFFIGQRVLNPLARNAYSVEDLAKYDLSIALADSIVTAGVDWTSEHPGKASAAGVHILQRMAANPGETAGRMYIGMRTGQALRPNWRNLDRLDAPGNPDHTPLAITALLMTATSKAQLDRFSSGIVWDYFDESLQLGPITEYFAVQFFTENGYAVRIEPTADGRANFYADRLDMGAQYEPPQPVTLQLPDNITLNYYRLQE